MNIGEYVRETMSVAAYDELLDRLELTVAKAPPEPEDLDPEALTRIDSRMQREVERIYRSVRAQALSVNPDRRQTTREQGRHFAYCRLSGCKGYTVIERVPVTDGSAFGIWRERPITQVFWHAPEHRWRCGCREFVRTQSCDHVTALAVLDDISSTAHGDAVEGPEARLCSCGHREFVGGLCTICHLLAEQRWLAQSNELPRRAVRERHRVAPNRWQRSRVAETGNPGITGAA